MASAVKIFEVDEGRTPKDRYKITVKYRRKTIRVFTKDTMHGAHRALNKAGYALIAWTENRKIILQD